MGQFSVEISRVPDVYSPYRKTDPRSFLGAQPARCSARQNVAFIVGVATAAAAAVVATAAAAAGHV